MVSRLDIKVKVIAKFKDGHTESIYDQSFLPTDSKDETTPNKVTTRVVSVNANDSIIAKVSVTQCQQNLILTKS